MEIEVKGPMEPYKILLEPYAVVIPGEVFIHTTLRRQFKVGDSAPPLLPPPPTAAVIVV